MKIQAKLNQNALRETEIEAGSEIENAELSITALNMRWPVGGDGSEVIMKTSYAITGKVDGQEVQRLGSVTRNVSALKMGEETVVPISALSDILVDSVAKGIKEDDARKAKQEEIEAQRKAATEKANARLEGRDPNQAD